MTALLSSVTGNAGDIDTLSGDFVPAIECWAPVNLGQVVAQSDVIALGTLSLIERELISGRVVIVPTEGLDLRAAYGFV